MSSGTAAKDKGDIILLDLPSSGRCASWSFNPIKTRMVLSYKNIPYKTEWVEYPDIKARVEPLGVPKQPTEQSYLPSYTIPVIILPQDDSAAGESQAQVVMDSAKIAHVLEQRYPSPSLHLDQPVVARIDSVLTELWAILAPNFYHLISPVLLNAPSAEYFERRRKVYYGMSLTEMHEKKGGEQPWRDASPLFDEIVTMLKKDGSGPFVLGETASYADFHLAATLRYMERLDKEQLARVLAIDPVIAKLYDACQVWLKRDD